MATTNRRTVIHGTISHDSECNKPVLTVQVSQNAHHNEDTVSSAEADVSQNTAYNNKQIVVSNANNNKGTTHAENSIDQC